MGIFLLILQGVLFWNVENFFDYRNDSTSVSDREFSSLGERHWTKRRFYTKCNAFAKAVLWIASTEGGLPDVIGLAEVENAFVLRRAVGATALRKAGYKIVHYDSPDPRGIDVALLYRAPAVELVSSKAIHIDSLRTRDILHVRLRARDGPETDYFVCHLPSKYGGEKESLARRARAVDRLLEAVDSVFCHSERMRENLLSSPTNEIRSAEGLGMTKEASGLGMTRRIIIMGDFNDTPDSPAFEELSRRFRSLAKPLAAKGLGTIRFDGRWDFIDHFYVSPGLETEMKPIQVPFFMTPDRTHGGLKPLRTYSGPRYTAGVSDHLPILLIK